METIYIYHLIDPRDGMIRYVGQTKDVKDRLASHLSPAFLKRTNRKNNWLKRLKSLNLKPEIELIEQCDPDDANRLEIFWIGYYRYIGIQLYNGTSGGQYEGYRMMERKKKTAEQIERQRDTLKEGYRSGRITNQNKGKPMSDEQKKKLSTNTNFRNLSKESIEKRAKTNTGKRRSGVIEMLDKDTMEVLNTFEGLSDINIFFGKDVDTNINNFLKERSKTKFPYGFLWRYKNAVKSNMDSIVKNNI